MSLAFITNASALSMQDAEAAEKRDDAPTAVRIYEEYAKAGNAQAMRRLAYFSQIGWGKKRDWLIAAKWLKNAYEAGDKSAASSVAFLGYNCQYMEGCNQDEIIKIVEELASQGAAPAQYGLARVLYEVKIDPPLSEDIGRIKEAVNLYLKAANQGEVDAQVAMAILSEAGLGVSQNYIEAHKWYNVAIQNTPPKYGDFAFKLMRKRDELAAKMTNDARQKAQALASAFEKK